MKKFTYIFAAILTLIVLSCRKNNDHTVKQYFIDTTLASGKLYELNLQKYGDADDIAEISLQGNNFSTSEILNQSGTFAPVYHYAAETKTSLTDKVVLVVKEGSGTNSTNRRNCDSTIITINFTIK